MTWSEVTVLVTVLLLLLAWALWVAASRLDRLHRKVASSRAVLDHQLVRRAAAATELAGSGLLDPVSSVLVGESAWAAASAGDARTEAEPVAATTSSGGRAVDRSTDRDGAQSELSRTLRVALGDPVEVAALREDRGGAELLDALAGAWYRVQLARRFHNEAVAQTQRVRRKWLVRLARLYGHAPMPQTVEIDDGWPEALARPGDVT